MRIVGVGFLRTGTTSLKLALERLGYGPCYHMRVLAAEPWRAADWAAVAHRPDAADWDRIFTGFDATVGSPGAAFWRQIVDAYPSAKVILTVRDPQDWYDSAAGTISRALAPPLPVRLLTWRRRPGDHLDEVQRLTRDREGGGLFADRDQAVAFFAHHLAAVRAHVPAERLLIFDVRDGWPPLCSFLGVPEPAEPFPRENDRAAFRRRWRRALARAVARRAAAATLAGAAMAMLVWAGRGWR
jgi:Sulfotransferase domain